jgi:SAM-dependent methyltransferase
MPTFKAFDWYENAVYYDMIFDTETAEDADFLEDVRERYGLTRGRRVLEPACGTGRLVAEFAARGYNVTGFDLCDGALCYARDRLAQRGLRARIVIADMADFAFRERFDLAFNLVSTFKYLSDERSARAHLECIAAALKPGGVYALGLHLSDYDDRKAGYERWLATRDGLDVTCVIYGWPADRRKRTERLRTRITVRSNGTVERYETNWTFRTYSLRQLKALLRSVPELEHVATYAFDSEIDEPIPFDGERLDNILILRRC